MNFKFGVTRTQKLPRHGVPQFLTSIFVTRGRSSGLRPAWVSAIEFTTSQLRLFEPPPSWANVLVSLHTLWWERVSTKNLHFLLYTGKRKLKGEDNLSSWSHGLHNGQEDISFFYFSSDIRFTQWADENRSINVGPFSQETSVESEPEDPLRSKNWVPPPMYIILPNTLSYKQLFLSLSWLYVFHSEGSEKTVRGRGVH